MSHPLGTHSTQEAERGTSNHTDRVPMAAQQPLQVTQSPLLSPWGLGAGQPGLTTSWALVLLGAHGHLPRPTLGGSVQAVGQVWQW